MTTPALVPVPARRPGVDLPVDGRGVRPEGSATRDVRQGWLGIRVLVVLAWAYGVVPSLVQILVSGRSQAAVSVEVPLVGLATAASQAISTAVTLTAGFLVLTAVAAHRPALPGRLAVYLLPWGALLVSGLHAGQVPGHKVATYLLIGLAFMYERPPVRVLSTAGWLTVATAVLSLGLGLVGTGLTAQAARGRAGFGTAGADTDKALIGHQLLAGPLSHANALGMVLAVGLPAVFLIESRRPRVLGTGAVALALVWTSSRTSLAAAALVVVCAWVLPRRRVGAALVAALSLVVVAVPLTTHAVQAYSGRGQIWLASLEVWRSHPWFGAGPSLYTTVAGVDNDFGRLAYHGHNLFVHLLATGGIVAVAATAVFLAAAACRAQRLCLLGQPFPILFLVGFLCVSTLEVVTSFLLLSAYGALAWVSFCVVFFGRADGYLHPVALPVRPGAHGAGLVGAG